MAWFFIILLQYLLVQTALFEFSKASLFFALHACYESIFPPFTLFCLFSAISKTASFSQYQLPVQVIHLSHYDLVSARLCAVLGVLDVRFEQSDSVRGMRAVLSCGNLGYAISTRACSGCCLSTLRKALQSKIHLMVFSIRNLAKNVTFV